MSGYDSTAGTLRIYGDVIYGRTPEWLYVAVREKRTTAQAMMLYGWLQLRYAQLRDGIFPGHKTLAAELGVTEWSVRQWLKQLRDVGAITWESRRRADGGATTNVYVLAWLGPYAFGPAIGQPTPHGEIPPPPCRDSTTPPGGIPTAPPGGIPPTKRQKQKETETTRQTSCPASEVTEPTLDLGMPDTPAADAASDPSQKPDHFISFWEIYPRLEGKLKAQASWAKAIKAGVDPQLILDGARRYRDDRNRDPQYTKLPATWLNGGHWDDDPLPQRTDRNGRPISTRPTAPKPRHYGVVTIVG